MGQSLLFPASRLSEPQLDRVCKKLSEAAELMSDDQILCVADALHDTLRQRRRLRCEAHERIERRLCDAGGAAAFPF